MYRPSAAVKQVEALRTVLAQEIEDIEAAISETVKEITFHTEAIHLAQKCIERAIQTKQTLEHLVTSGLRDIFQEDYKFVFEPVYSKEKVLKGLEPTLYLRGRKLDDIMEDTGDGVLGIISFLLLISTIMVHPQCPKILVADEILAEVDSEAWERTGQFVCNLCQESDLQLILITHEVSPFGKVIEVSQKDGIAKATTIKNWSNIDYNGIDL